MKRSFDNRDDDGNDLDDDEIASDGDDGHLTFPSHGKRGASQQR